MVKLAPALPKEYDDNGLESNTRHLLGIYPKQEYVPIVALIRTKEITQTENFERVPKVELVHVEIAIDADDQEAVRDLIQQLHDARVQHIKQPLDLPDTEEPPLAPILELEASDGMYSVIVVDEDKRKFTLVLVAPSGAKVTERHALPRKDYGELEPGDYPLSALTGDALELAQALIQDYEQGFAVVDEGDVVDAELVDESTTDTTQED
jgi:hypothetical protein